MTGPGDELPRIRLIGARTGDDLSPASWQPWVRRSLVKENDPILGNQLRGRARLRVRHNPQDDAAMRVGSRRKHRGKLILA
jgi:hypothetical protein